MMRLRRVHHEAVAGANRERLTRIFAMGLEGIVSKRRDRPYRAGRSPDWIKVKNRKHPAISRVADSFA
jgi:ATP-dependent DNA ligase